MEQRRSILHGFKGIGDDRERLVFDLDQVEGFPGDVYVLSCDRSHSVTFVEHLVLCEAIGCKVGQVDGAFAEVGDLVPEVRKIR